MCIQKNIYGEDPMGSCFFSFAWEELSALQGDVADLATEARPFTWGRKLHQA